VPRYVCLSVYLCFLKPAQVLQGLKDLPDKIKEVLALEPEIKAAAQDLYKQSSLLVMGRGFNFANCLEGALKIKVMYMCVMNSPWSWSRRS
jgi:glucosamine 6-phosphate synthetase-like amidotransferase/phosphosugar isomerase protein